MDIDIDAALDALGDPMRRRIIGRLAVGPLDVGGISAGMPIGRTAVSMHLRRLRDHLDWYWERSLAAYQRAAEARAKEQDMTTEQEIVVAKTVRVNAPLAVAFEVF